METKGHLKGTAFVSTNEPPAHSQNSPNVAIELFQSSHERSLAANIIFQVEYMDKNIETPVRFPTVAPEDSAKFTERLCLEDN
jgi:hypothetical protein